MPPYSGKRYKLSRAGTFSPPQNQRIFLMFSTKNPEHSVRGNLKRSRIFFPKGSGNPRSISQRRRSSSPSAEMQARRSSRYFAWSARTLLYGERSFGNGHRDGGTIQGEKSTSAAAMTFG